MSTTLFNRYLSQRIADAQADLPHEKVEVVRTLLRELMGEHNDEGKGIIPVDMDGDGWPEIAEFQTSHPVYRALLDGEPVAIEGERVTTTQGGGMEMRKKIILFGAGSVCLLAMVGLLAWVVLRPSGGDESITDVSVAVAMVGDQAEHDPSPTVIPPTELPPTPTSPTPVIVEPTALPAVVEEVRGKIAEQPTDPVSIKLAGESHLLAVGEIKGSGEWKPKDAQWLNQSRLRRVIAIPYSDKLAETSFETDPILLRLRNGEIVTYDEIAVHRVRRDQIEFMTGNTPSIAVILYGETGDERTVFIGHWRDEQER